MAKKSTKKKTTAKKVAAKSIKAPVSEAVAKKPAKTPMRITFKSLRAWNIILAVLLAAQATVIGIIGNSATMSVTNNYLAVDSLASNAAGHTVYAQATRHMLDVNLILVIATFLCISAFFHLLTATYFRNRYEDQLTHQTNKLRWIDYGLSAGVMLMAVGLLNGVSDIASLLMIFVLVGLLHVFGYFLETRNDAKSHTKWQIFTGMLIAGGAVWLVIASYVKGAVIYGVGLPHFIYWIDGTIFALTVLLAANTLLSFERTGKWADYLYGERAYMLLSFTVKTALAWQIFAGLLR